ncbi:DNA polymerase IV [Metabacillus rhizolycopersici]|uniref:DNA polymerase IV n=1 Tax=Metabacillus rhizolycopersici TaxID=2875709 RepID=A0ABS7UTL5_9BACI|nr:DNA polymerase IV [Metabacillus rhizolycopersici]MBZ5751353.1 DNA polymerase IV [Metabacillus rhizolycopersici]
MKKKVIFLADCQSFYASVEKAAHPQYANKPLAVAGDPKRRSGIVLAACPIAKSFGVSTAESLREAFAKCPELVAIQPRMQEYVNVSLQITSILESYTNLVEPFSIDEQFLDVTASLHFFESPRDMALHIQKRILIQTGIYVRIGIGENKVLAKMACDNFAKKNADGIFELTKSNITEYLWPLTPDKMFGVGSKTLYHLHQIGLKTIGDVAKTSVADFKGKLQKYHGKKCDILAQVLWATANGIDYSPVTPDAFSLQKGIGRQTTLPIDYYKAKDIEVVLLELSSLVCQRSRYKGYMGTVVHVGIQGADFKNPTGFHRQKKLRQPSCLTSEVFETVKMLFHQYWNQLPVRKIFVSLSQFQTDDCLQLSFFENRERQLSLEKCVDSIKQKFGETSIFFASSLTRSGQAKFLAQKIGGHIK